MIQCDLFISQLEVTICLWKGYLTDLTIPKKSQRITWYLRIHQLFLCLLKCHLMSSGTFHSNQSHQIYDWPPFFASKPSNKTIQQNTTPWQSLPKRKICHNGRHWPCKELGLLRSNRSWSTAWNAERNSTINQLRKVPVNSSLWVCHIAGEARWSKCSMHLGNPREKDRKGIGVIHFDLMKIWNENSSDSFPSSFYHFLQSVTLLINKIQSEAGRGSCYLSKCKHITLDIHGGPPEVRYLDRKNIPSKHRSPQEVWLDV